MILVNLTGVRPSCLYHARIRVIIPGVWLFHNLLHTHESVGKYVSCKDKPLFSIEKSAVFWWIKLFICRKRKEVEKVYRYLSSDCRQYFKCWLFAFGDPWLKDPDLHIADDKDCIIILVISLIQTCRLRSPRESPCKPNGIRSRENLLIILSN